MMSSFDHIHMKTNNLIKTFIGTFVLALHTLGLAGCSRMNITRFEGNEPRFLPEEYFIGEVRGYGVFYDRFANLKRSFLLILHGEMEDDTLVLQEDLRFKDGEHVLREYRLKKVSEHRYEASSEAFEGPATVTSYGNALQWDYTLKQPVKGKVWHLPFDDWMFLMDDGVVLNRARASKWGFDVGEVFMTLRRIDDKEAFAPTSTKD